jgi:hypothetical protein
MTNTSKPVKSGKKLAAAKKLEKKTTLSRTNLTRLGSV